MNLFKKKTSTSNSTPSGVYHVTTTSTENPSLHVTIEAPKPLPEKWVWVDGYKAFEADLSCRGMQYVKGMTHEFEGKVELCASGYHLCLNLNHTLAYYSFDFNRRYFAVRALVKEGSVKAYSEKNNKLVAKKLKVGEELSETEYYELFKYAQDKRVEYSFIESIEDFREYAKTQNADGIMGRKIVRDLGENNLSELYTAFVVDRLVYKYHYSQMSPILTEMQALISMNLSNDMLVYHIEKLFNR